MFSRSSSNFIGVGGNRDRHEWFLSMIGQRIYRTSSGLFLDVYENGIIVEDRMTAKYLARMEQDEGVIYFKTKKERDAHIKRRSDQA